MWLYSGWPHGHRKPDFHSFKDKATFPWAQLETPNNRWHNFFSSSSPLVGGWALLIVSINKSTSSYFLMCTLAPSQDPAHKCVLSQAGHRERGGQVWLRVKSSQLVRTMIQLRVLVLKLGKWHPSYRLKILSCIQNGLALLQLFDFSSWLFSLSGLWFTKDMT